MKRDLTAVISDIKNDKGLRLLLIFGDDSLIQQACKTIIELLVPKSHTSFNLERFDGRTASWDSVQASLLTPPFFPGKKVIWIENAPYFFSREQKSGLGERAVQLWSEGKKEEAREALADMLVVEGWTQEQWDQIDAVSSGHLLELLDVEGVEARNEGTALLAYCKGQGINLSARKGVEDQRLGECLERGLPEWAFMVLTAVQVDRRIRLYKRLEEAGAVLYLDVEREKSGRLSRERVLEFISQRLRAAGKTLDVQARQQISLRAGDDLRELGHEVDKLILYAADQTIIRADDVAAVFTDRGADWVFDLTRAIAERDALAALGHLGRLITQGEHPLKLLATIAAELRRLLLARQLLDNELHGCWRRGMSYSQFQQRIVNQSTPMPSRNPYADYMLFQRADKFSISALRRHMAEICEADLRLKSSGGNPRLAMERLVLNLCLHA